MPISRTPYRASKAMDSGATLAKAGSQALSGACR